MNNTDGSARSENREYAGLIKTGGVCGAVLDLGAGAESMNARVYQVTECVIYLGAVERRARAGGIGDIEAILGEGVQNSAGIFEEFEGLVTGVGNYRGDLQVLQSVNIDVWG